MGTHPIFESDFDCLTEKKMDYKVAVKTKKNLFAGTDAQVFCRLTDVNGVTTPTIWLKDETKKVLKVEKKMISASLLENILILSKMSLWLIFGNVKFGAIMMELVLIGIWQPLLLRMKKIKNLTISLSTELSKNQPLKNKLLMV